LILIILLTIECLPNDCLPVKTLQTPEVEANGRVEWFVATGKQTPKKPFFFLQEYKQAPQPPKGEDIENDPLGQLLISMLCLKHLNNAPPSGAGGLLYGCYNIGRIWFFVLLVGKEYAISRAYGATQTDGLTDMVAILKKVKVYIHEQLGLPAPV
jgi:hypothetical protein